MGHGVGSLISKCDVSEAFRIIPVHPSCHHLLGFTWGGKLFYDMVLPMGCSQSCQIFEAFTSSLQWIMKHNFGVPFISHILDDFIFDGPKDSDLCSRYLAQFLKLADIINLPIKHSKTVLPSTCVIAHGIEIDTGCMTLRLPQEKLIKISLALERVGRKHTIQLRELQSILGLLSWACLVVKPGRPFLRRLITLTKGLSNNRHYVTMNKEARSDLHAWAVFIKSYNGVSVFPSVSWSSNKSLQLFTDASSSFGCAGVYGKKWFQISWDSPYLSSEITLLELHAIVVALHLWGSSLANNNILFRCDNLAVVHILNNMTSRDPTIMKLVRKFVLFCLSFNICFHLEHISSVNNVICDKLSRLQIQEARRLAPHLNPEPDLVPPVLFLHNLLGQE